FLIVSALQQVDLRIDHENLSLCRLSRFVLHHHRAARRADRKVRFSGHAHGKHLQVRGDIELSIAILDYKLSQIYCPTLWRDGPQDVGQILGAELRWAAQIFE